MKLNKSLLRTMLVVAALTALIACGGGGDGSTTPENTGGTTTPINNDNTTSETDDTANNPLSSDSFTLDESVFDNTSNFTKFYGRALTPSVDLSQGATGLNITTTDIRQNSRATLDLETQYRFPTTLAESTITAQLNKPLYIDGDFAGIIDHFDNGTIVVRNADKISDIYDRFDISASNDEMEQTVRQSIKRSIGAYDHLNKTPLKVSFTKKDIVTKSKTLVQEPVVVIEFPKGYTLPLKPVNRSSVNVDCDLDEAMCDASFNYDNQYEKDFEVTKEFGEVTFTTDGSKVEIGLGAYIRAMYDYNTIGANQYYFEFKPSIYYLVNLEMSIKGGAIAAAEETFDIVENGLDIEIPLHKVVKLNLNLKPEIVIGMESAPNNENIEFKATLKSKRTGFVKLTYSNGGGTAKAGIVEENDPLVKSAITLKTDTGTDKIVGYLFPEIAVRPQLSFIKIDKKVNIAYVRNGVRIDTKIKGVIDDNWIVENTAVSGSSYEDVYLKTFLYGLIDFKWDIKAGDYEIWSSDNWKELYKSGEFKILEWMSQFLHEPRINVASSNAARYVDFDILSGLKDYIRFYYTTDGTDLDKEVINDNRDSTPYDIWRIGDDPIVLTEDKVVNVRAVVFTDEIAEKDDTLWRWGMSTSNQAKRVAIYLPKPTITPAGKDFIDTITVSASETEGNMIQYSENGSTVYKDCGVGSCSVTISDTSYMAFRTMKVIDGEEFYSDNTLGTYRKCPSHETLDEGGACVTQCPYLWDVHYTQGRTLFTGGSSDEEEWIYSYGSSTFLNILIYPRCDYTLTQDEYNKCEPYFNHQTDYFSHIVYETDEGPDVQPSEPGDTTFGYAGLTESGLCNRDPYPDASFDELPAGYKDYYIDTNTYTAEGDYYDLEGAHPDHSQDVFPGISAVHSFGIKVESDIFGEIFDRQSFTVSKQNSTYQFTPRSYVPSNNGDDDGEIDLCAEYGYGCEDEDDGEDDGGNNSDDDEDNGGNVDGDYEDYEGKWKFSVNFVHNDYGSGTMTVTDFIIDLSPESWGGADQYAMVDSPANISFTGSLQYDEDLTPLVITDAQFMAPLSKVVKFSALLPYEGLTFQVGSDEFPGGPSGTSCDGHMPSDATAKIYNNETITWTWANSIVSCTYTLTPCPNGTCQ